MPNIPVPDLDLIHSWRCSGVSFIEIGRRLARKHGRSVVFNSNSVAKAYRRWLDARGIKPDPDKVDLRYKRR